MSELAFASATELAEKIRNKEISALELLNHYLSRVDRFNPEINAIIVDIRERARSEAAKTLARVRKACSKIRLTQRMMRPSRPGGGG